MTKQGAGSGGEANAHRQRIREILLDKGILAIIVALVVAFSNARLADVRAGHERQRVLAEREVDAYEHAWQALIDLRAFLAPLRERPSEPELEKATMDAAFKFASAIDAEAIYLAPDLYARIARFSDSSLANFVTLWSDAAPVAVDASAWQALDADAEALRIAIREEVYKRRSNGPPT